MDLLQKAISLGFIPTNKDYYLWEIQKWLREKHNIDIIIKPYTGDIKGTKTYAADITIFGSNKYIKLSRYDTYEQALEAALFEALKLIS